MSQREKEPPVTVSAALPLDLFQRLEQRRRELDVKRSILIRDIITNHLRDVEEQKNERVTL